MRQTFLPRCLASLGRQFDAPDYEVIVVDNASTDGTALVVKQYGARVISETKKGVVHARQAGFRASRGDIVVSTDSDSFFRENWLKNIAHFYETHPEAVGLAGHYYFYRGPFWAKTLPPMGALAVWLLSRVTQRPIYVSATNLSFRKIAFHGYDVRFHQGADERGVLLQLSQAGRVYITLKNPVYTSSRRVNQGFLHSMLVTVGYYYSFSVWHTKKNGFSKIGSPPAIRTEDRLAHLPILLTQWVIIGTMIVAGVEVLKHHLWSIL